MSDRDRYIATTIIDALAPSGLLSISLQELYDSFEPELEVELDEIEAVRHRIQQFDPLWYCQRRPDRLPLWCKLAHLSPCTPWREQAAQIINRHLPLLASRDFTQLVRRTRLKERELGEVIQLIRSLNPKPGDAFSDNAAEYIIPDVFVKKREKQMGSRIKPRYCTKT